MTDLFKTVVLRVDRQDRQMFTDGRTSLRYGDSLKVFVAADPGLDADGLELWIYPCGVACTAANAIAFTGSFSATSGSDTDAYATISLLTDAAGALTGAVPTGSTTPVFLQLLESGVVVGECTLELGPNPGADGSAAVVSDPFVRASDFSGVAAIQAMPSRNAAELEAKFNALLALLNGIAGA